MSQEMTTISPADFNEFVKHSFGRIGAKITDFLWMAGHHGMCFFFPKSNRWYSFYLIPGKSSLEIADGIGFHVEIVERYLKVLENDGFVKRIATLSTNPVYAIEFEV
jgi:hypothetical protein